MGSTAVGPGLSDLTCTKGAFIDPLQCPCTRLYVRGAYVPVRWFHYYLIVWGVRGASVMTCTRVCLISCTKRCSSIPALSEPILWRRTEFWRRVNARTTITTTKCQEWVQVQVYSRFPARASDITPRCPTETSHYVVNDDLIVFCCCENKHSDKPPTEK